MTGRRAAAGSVILVFLATACATNRVPGWSRNPRYSGCTPAELRSISRAFAHAAKLSDAALAAANDPANQRRAESDDWNSYSWWFGEFDATRFASVQAVLAATRSEFEGTLTMACGAEKADCSGLAHANHDIRVVQVCSDFFGQSRADQAAILFYNVTRIASDTTDFVYREQDLLALARSHPGRATRSAGSYAAFAESVVFGRRPRSHELPQGNDDSP